MLERNIEIAGRTVLVTGAAGFIGSALARKLLEEVEGVEVVGIDSITDYYDTGIKEERLRGLAGYKFFCFDGKVKAMFLVTGRGIDTRLDWFDENFNHLPFERGYRNADTPPERPARFEEMKRLAERLSTGMPHVRVDLYEIAGKIYFGEFTFFPGSGYEKFVPEEWDYKFGEFITLPDPMTE